MFLLFRKYIIGRDIIMEIVIIIIMVCVFLIGVSCVFVGWYILRWWLSVINMIIKLEVEVVV